MYIYAFPCQELFKCEALLAMPENVYYQKVSSYRLPNGKDYDNMQRPNLFL